jgi:NAD+ synthase
MTDRDTQRRIIDDLEVVADFDAACETERRIRFLAEYVQHTSTQGLVLGISGGVDSAVAGRLCQLACERMRAEGGDAAFVAIRLPYGLQKDEADANQAVAAIAADEVYTVNIKSAVDGIWDAAGRPASRSPTSGTTSSRATSRRASG